MLHPEEIIAEIFVGNHMPAIDIQQTSCNPKVTPHANDSPYLPFPGKYSYLSPTPFPSYFPATTVFIPPIPPVPPQPQQRRRNRCPCGGCCVGREFNTPGEFSFHAKAAVAVDAATTAITTTDHPRRILPPSTPSTPPPTAAAEIAMITLNPADIAIAAAWTQNYYSWGSGSFTEAGARGSYRRGRRQA